MQLNWTSLFSVPRGMAAIVLLFVLFAVPGQASAQTCQFSITDFDFGSIDPTANTSIVGSGSLTINCTGTAGAGVLVCANFGAGTSGADSNGAVRQLSSGINFMNFNLYGNAAATNIWGSYVSGWSGNAPPDINLTIGSNGKASKSRAIYAKIPAGQQTTPRGTYTSSFTGADVQIYYAYSTVASSCSTLTSGRQAPATFNVQATVISRCTVMAGELNFGSVGLINTNIDATNTISIACTAGAPSSIGLNNGISGATSPSQRHMSSAQGSIVYGIYANSGRSIVWGDVNNGQAQGGTGTGLTQNFKAFGRVPPQTSPPPGSYADTIVVTVTY